MISSGEIVLREGTVECRLTEISQHGAKLIAKVAASVGDYGVLRCDGLDILSRVVWVDGEMLAIEFVDEANDEDAEQDMEQFSRVVRNHQILRLLGI